MGTGVRMSAAIGIAAAMAMGPAAAVGHAAAVGINGTDLVVVGDGLPDEVTMRALQRTSDSRGAVEVEIRDTAAMTSGPGCRVRGNGHLARCGLAPSSGQRLRRFFVVLGGGADKLVWTDFNGIVRTYFEGRGGDGNDVLSLPPAGDRLYGDGGSDLLSGGAGGDRLFGGNGNDVVAGAAGDDVVNGQFGNDRVYGGTGRDWLFGGAGADELRSRDARSDRTVSCGSGDDRLLRDRVDPFLSNCERVFAG